MIVATAGHVDHGKTLLVRQLTGVDTDRLAEEKRRGLSIDLGFAYQSVGANKTLGFIDVPGHSRFINNMISGISGIDLGLIVVAADDGPMPQTREHLDVLKLLGVRDYAVAVTKVDRVPPARVIEVSESISALIGKVTGDKQIPLFAVSNTEGTGLDELKAFLTRKAETSSDKNARGNFRLSIDRVFTLKGVGLVVAGTIISGQVNVGDTLRFEPQGQKVRVRSLHAHGAESKQNIVGERCALNIVGSIERDAIERGDWLVSPSVIGATQRFDAQFVLREDLSDPLKNLIAVTLHIGAKKEKAKITILTAKTVESGKSELIQVMTDRPIVCCNGDRFLIRNDGEDMTLGGGVVLDPFAPKRGKSSASRLDYLRALDQRDAETALATIVLDLEQLIDLDRFRLAWNLRDDEMSSILESSNLQQKIKTQQTEQGAVAVSSALWQDASTEFMRALDTALKQRNDTSGVPYASLVDGLRSKFQPRLIELVFNSLVRESKVAATDGLLSLPQRQVQFSKDESMYWQPLQKYLVRLDNKPAALQVIAEDLNLPLKPLKAVALKAAKLGELAQVSETRFVLPKTIGKFGALALKLGTNAEFSVVDFKDGAGIGRTLAVEILEYFDRLGFTARRGNARILLDKSRIQRFLQ